MDISRDTGAAAAMSRHGVLARVTDVWGGILNPPRQ
jgi:hypothetical protein